MSAKMLPFMREERLRIIHETGTEEMAEKIFKRVCAVKELPRRRGKRIMFDEDRQVAIFNINDNLFAVDNICPHQHAPVIADGMIEDCTITCPLHGRKYNLATGEGMGGHGPIRTYEIYLNGEDVMLEEPEKKDPSWMKGW